MFCSQCGKEIPQGSETCPYCSAPRSGSQGSSTGPSVAIDNGLVPAVLATIFCCMPLGLIGLIKASNIDSLVAQGRIEEARADAKEAAKWTRYAVIAGVIIWVGTILIYGGIFLTAILLVE